VLTKPFHHSQQLIEKDYYGITISLDVQHNFELEKLILGFGDGIRVIGPERLKRNIKDRLNGAMDLYQTEISESGLTKASRRLTNKGFSILNNVYTQRSIRKIKKVLDNYFSEADEIAFGKRLLVKELPQLKPLLFSKNLQQIVRTIDKNAFLTKAIYFDKPQQKNWYVSWHQDVPINVTEKIATDGYTSWTKEKEINSVCPPEDLVRNIFSIRIHLDDTNHENGALKVIPGSHQKRLSDEQIQTITENSIPYVCEVNAGGIQIIKPLLLHSSSKAINQKRRRVIHLEFSSEELLGELDWLERENLKPFTDEK